MILTRFSIAASRIMNIESVSQVMQIGLSFWLKNSSPSYPANTGNCSNTESLILQFLSLLSSVREGIIDCSSSLIPITLLRSSNLLKRFKRTSELSSLSRFKKIGKMCSLVCALSMIGQIERIFSASADLT